MRIVCISDTHGQHKRVKLPEGDVLIHAGDFTMSGGTAEVGGFLNWLKQQPYKHKILIAGNHDRLFEQDPALAESMMPAGVTYLNDSGTVIDGLNFWGSPVQPEFCNWAFNRNQAEIVAHWELIPDNTDVLITHGPPQGVLDVARGSMLGCWDLARHVARVKPQLHVFGHIHEGYGEAQVGDVHYVNASQLDESYYLCNAPVVVDL